MTSTTRRARWLALLVLCLGDLMIVLDSTIVNVALPSIRADLGFSESSLAWVVDAYLQPDGLLDSSNLTKPIGLVWLGHGSPLHTTSHRPWSCDVHVVSGLV
jgi:MFS family permease